MMSVMGANGLLVLRFLQTNLHTVVACYAALQLCLPHILCYGALSLFFDLTDPVMLLHVDHAKG